jgi:hypothetical protein
VFPCRLKIMRECIFCRKDPIVLGVQVMEGIARVGTPIAIPSQNFITIGKIASMEVRAPASDPCPWLGSGLEKRQGLPNMGVLKPQLLAHLPSTASAMKRASVCLQRHARAYVSRRL